MARPALHLVLELTRASAAADPGGVADGEWNRYLLRYPDDSGRYEEGELVWDEATKAALIAAGDAATAQAAIDQLSKVLRSLVGAAGWPSIAARIAAARSCGRAVAITLRSAAHELYALPWELLDLAGTPLYAADDCLLRYAIAGNASPPRLPPPSSRVLVAGAAAGGGVPIREHVAAIAAAARAGCVAFDPERDVLADATCGALTRALSEAPVSVLHLLCHGEKLAGGRGFGLRLDRERGPVTPEEMAAFLAPHADTLRLVVLAACFGAAPAAIDHALDNVAQAIHAAGVAAVVASRYLLTLPGSIELTRVLYDQLWQRKTSLQSAFVASRAALRVRQHGPDERSDVDALAVQLHGADAPALDFRPWIFRPYRGLGPYDRDDASFYFGREDDRAALLQLVATALAQPAPRFVLVAGASGTGKSSVVRAGLVPDLEAGALARSPRWTTAVMRPGEGGKPVEILTGLELHRLAQPNGGTVVLVVDQLEELFTTVERDDDREALLRELWRLACEPGGRVFVIATMRIEYLGRLGSVRMDDGTTFDRGMLAAGRYHFLRQLGLPEYQRIIEGPAELAGVRLEGGLVERLLETLRAEPGALPLLSFALDKLWQDRSFQTVDVDDPDQPGRHVPVTGWWLTHAAYVALGGISGALARSADQLLHELTPAETDELRRVLVQLVQGHDDPQLVTRRRGWRDELRPDAIAEPEAARIFDRVLDAWICARLIVAGSAGPDAPVWVELAHDSLIRFWPTFGGWYREARAWLGQADELLAAARDWRAHAGPDAAAYLLRGQRLAYHLEAWERFRVHLGAQDRELARGYLETCGRADAEDRARMVEAERRSAVAEERAVAARDATIMSVALQLRDAGQPAWTTKLLGEVARPLLTAGWLSLAGDQLTNAPLASTLHHPSKLESAVFSANGAFVLTVSCDGDARLWRADGRGDPVVLRDHPAQVSSAAFSPDSALVLTGADDGIARIWRVDGAASPAQFHGHEDAIGGVSFSPDGQRFATFAYTSARVWRIDQQLQSQVLAHDDHVFAASFSPDSNQVVTRCGDGAARLWPADGRAPPIELRHPDSEGLRHDVNQVRFTRDGKFVVTCAWQDNTVRVWRLDDLAHPRVVAVNNILALSPDGNRLAHVAASDAHSYEIVHVLTLVGPNGAVMPEEMMPAKMFLPGISRYAAFSPDGARLAIAASQLYMDPRLSPRTLHMWDIGSYPRQLSRHEADVTGLVFSSDGRQLVSASLDSTARIWRTEEADLARTEVLSPEPDEEFVAAGLGPDGPFVVSSDQHNGLGIRLGRASGSEPLVIRVGHDVELSSIAFSSDGKRAVTGTSEGEVRVWSLDPGDRGSSTSFAGHRATVRSAAFSRDSKRVITGSLDSTARVWSLDDPSDVVVLAADHSVDAVAFSADGRLAAAGCHDGTARVWRVTEPRDVITLGHTDGLGVPAVRAVAFNRDAQYLLTRITRNAAAQVWRLDGGDRQAPILHLEAISAATFSDDGARIVFGSSEGSAQIRHLDDLERWTIVDEQARGINLAAFSPDGELVVTVSGRTARVSRVADPNQFMVLRHGRTVTSVQFSADSTQLLVLEDNLVTLWTVGAETLRARLLDASTDCLPPELRQRYLGETPAEARKHYEICERSHGRTPRAS